MGSFPRKNSSTPLVKEVPQSPVVLIRPRMLTMSCNPDQRELRRQANAIAAQMLRLANDCRPEWQRRLAVCRRRHAELARKLEVWPSEPGKPRKEPSNVHRRVRKFNQTIQEADHDEHRASQRQKTKFAHQLTNDFFRGNACKSQL